MYYQILDTIFLADLKEKQWQGYSLKSVFEIIDNISLADLKEKQWKG